MMPQYIPLLVNSGYDNTDFLLGISVEVRVRMMYVGVALLFFAFSLSSLLGIG